MSLIARDDTYLGIQCFGLPVSGETTTLSVGPSTSNNTANLSKGIYRVVSDTAVALANGATAVVTDLPLRANVEEFFFIDTNEQISAYNATGSAATIYITRMP